MEEIQVTIYGNVQGVGFRYWAREQALTLNIKGLAKNETDGSVTVVGQGERKNLEKFLAICQSNPPAGKVVNVTVNWQKPKEQFDSFVIR